jgi:hypothetical protein
MEAAWLPYWDSPDMMAKYEGPPSNNFTPLEQAMLENFRASGQKHLVSAFMKRRKYSRAWRSVKLSSRLDPPHLLFRREAFLGEAATAPLDDDVALCEGIEAYENLLRDKYANDEGYKKYLELEHVQAYLVDKEYVPMTWTGGEKEGEEDE